MIEEQLTIARSLFKDMNRSGCFVRLMDSMSRGRRRGCWRACTKWLAWPLGASHIEALYGMAAPPISNRGAQGR